MTGAITQIGDLNRRLMLLAPVETHIHSVAAAAGSAVARATTIPSGDVSALNAKIDGLGNRL